MYIYMVKQMNKHIAIYIYIYTYMLQYYVYTYVCIYIYIYIYTTPRWRPRCALLSMGQPTS